MSKLDEKSVSNIIRIAMANNEKCRTCEFRGTCFFACACLSNIYKHYLKETEKMTLYVVHGNTYYGGYGHVENIFGVYTEKDSAEAAKDLTICRTLRWGSWKLKLMKFQTSNLEDIANDIYYTHDN